MKKIANAFNSGRAIFFLLILICCILVGAVLKLASSVILPFTVAVLLAFSMYPLVKVLDKHKIPRFISILLVVFIIIAGLSVLGFVLFSSGSNILSVFPIYEERLMEIYIYIAQLFELPYDETLGVWDNLWSQFGVRNWIRGFAFSFSNVFLSFMSSAVLVIFFVIFILLEANYFKEKLTVAFENRSDRINRMGHDLMTQVTRYLTAKFFISLGTGVIVAFGLWLIGVEFPILWGVLAFILNFIPTLGSIAGGFIISLFSLIQFWPEPLPVILVVVLVIGTNMVIGNIIDPKVIGDHVGISPLMVLIAMSIWGYIWGFAGMILAVPMTSIIKIVCENIPILEPISAIIGSKRSVKAKKAWKLPRWKLNVNNESSEEQHEDNKSENGNIEN